uniref:Uncharacterized protein n=1 Tax=Tanacetum cinerariifolium TaxID=118510 RepID=A0A699H210_TANCI|nr:hypothetical protein [Tanacetum cinerariifolium]
MCEMACKIVQKKLEEKRIEENQAAQAQNSKIPACSDDEDDYNFAITPNEPVDSLSMGDEHLYTISATESDEFIKSCVENLVPNPSESEGENSCDFPACFTTFSNILFDSDYESDSSEYKSCSDEDFLEEIYSNPLFEEEIIPMKIDQHYFNAESDLIKSMLNHDSSIIPFSSKIDSLLDEFVDNSSPRPPKEFVFDNSDADIESFSSYPILDEDSDSRMKEIDLTFTPDDPMPPSIEDDDNDSERDIIILKEFPSNYSLSLSEIESFYFDIPSFSHPLAKPPDGNTRILNIKIIGDVSDQKVPIPGLTITRASNQEKSPDLLSHRSFEILQNSAKCPMMIHGKNIPILDVSLFYFYPLDQLNSQPTLKSSYNAKDGVIISIPPLVGGVADVVVEIKGTDLKSKTTEDIISNRSFMEVLALNHYVLVKKVLVVRSVWNNSRRVNRKKFANKMTHPHPKRRFIPQAILTKSDKLETAGTPVNTVRLVNTADSKPIGNPQQKEYKEKGVIDSGCSRHMTGNKCYLTDYEDYDGRFVSFGDGKGRISKKGKIKTRTLDFDDVYFTKDNIVVGQAKKKKEPEQEYILIPICTTDPLIFQGPKDSAVDVGKKATKVHKSQVSDNGRKGDQVTRSEFEGLLQQERQTKHINSTNSFNNVSSPVNNVGPSFVNVALPSPINAVGTPAIGTKWVFRNKKDERGIVIKNKAILVAQGHTQEECINYDEVFAPVARIEAIRLFLAYGPFKDFVVYQMDVNSAFLYGKIKEEIASTPMEPNKALVKDAENEDVDMHLYRSMIRSLMYLTASRPNITFVVCACTRFQVTPKTSHLHAVERIFRYIKGQPKLGLWYSRDSPFDLEAYSNSNYTRASLDRKSTTEEYVAAVSYCRQTTTKVKKVNGQEQIQALVDKPKVIITEEIIRCDLQFDDAEGTACLPNDTIFEELPKIGAKTTAWNEFNSTMASAIICLSNNQKFNFSKYIFDHMVKHLEGGVKFLMFPRFLQVFANMRRKGQGFSGNVTPLFETMMVNAQEEVAEDHSPSSKIPVEESILTPSNDPLPSGEDSIQLNELIIFCTNLQQQVLNLEEAKIAQAKDIAKLKKRVKKLRKRRKSRPAGLRRLKKRVHDADMFGVNDLEGNEVFVDVREKIIEKEVSTADPVTATGEVVTAASVKHSVVPTTITTADVDDELTLAKTLISIKAAKPKVILIAITTPRAQGIVFHEQVQAHIPTVSSLKDKGKAKMIEPEKPLKKKDQIALDEEVERKLEAEMRAKIEEEERIVREKDEANRAVIKE